MVLWFKKSIQKLLNYIDVLINQLLASLEVGNEVDTSVKAHIFIRLIQQLQNLFSAPLAQE